MPLKYSGSLVDFVSENNLSVGRFFSMIIKKMRFIYDFEFFFLNSIYKILISNMLVRYLGIKQILEMVSKICFFACIISINHLI